MTNNSKVVLGVAAAAAAGAVIGMMFAPEKGSDIREKLRETANNFASDLLDALQNGRTQYAQVAEEVEDAAQNAKSKVVGKVAEIKDRVETEAGQFTNSLKS